MERRKRTIAAAGRGLREDMKGELGNNTQAELTVIKPGPYVDFPPSIDSTCTTNTILFTGGQMVNLCVH